jgi:hypothetical protein
MVPKLAKSLAGILFANRNEGQRGYSSARMMEVISAPLVSRHQKAKGITGPKND